MNNPNRSTAYAEFCSHAVQGHLLLAVTLSTKIKNNEEGERFTESQFFRSLWEQHLIGQFALLIPSSKSWSIDSWYRLHRNPAFHFHGIVVIHKNYADRVWSNGELRARLTRTLNAWRKNRKGVRPCEVSQFEISRIANTQDQCAKYTTWGADAIGSWMNYCAHEEPRAEMPKYKSNAFRLST
jgi:hypothetical protein